MAHTQGWLRPGPARPEQSSRGSSSALMRPSAFAQPSSGRRDHRQSRNAIARRLGNARHPLEHTVGTCAAVLLIDVAPEAKSDLAPGDILPDAGADATSRNRLLRTAISDQVDHPARDRAVIAIRFRGAAK